MSTDACSGWRSMTAADLPAVMAIAAEVHPAYPEDEAVFAERLRLAPAGCHVLVDERGVLGGYLVSHPWAEGTIPTLNSLLGAVPEGVTSWYLHDLALLPAARGTGAARAIVTKLAKRAGEAGYRSLTLVAVNGSAAFWRRQGFFEVAAPELAEKLATYDAAACYMRRGLT
jgi:ribosomal protein S18 acetylase RimI-like enzyme